MSTQIMDDNEQIEKKKNNLLTNSNQGCLQTLHVTGEYTQWSV